MTKAKTKVEEANAEQQPEGRAEERAPATPIKDRFTLADGTEYSFRAPKFRDMSRLARHADALMETDMVVEAVAGDDAQKLLQYALGEKFEEFADSASIFEAQEALFAYLEFGRFEDFFSTAQERLAARKATRLDSQMAAGRVMLERAKASGSLPKDFSIEKEMQKLTAEAFLQFTAGETTTD